MDYFEAALKARAYIQTTAQHGPSKQLLDFINYDGNLYTDLGLESLGLETMSLTTQHEIVLSKLNPNDLDRLGLEGLKEKLYTLGSALTLGGIGVGFLGTRNKDPNKIMKLCGITLAAIVAGQIVFKIADKTKPDPLVISYSTFIKIRSQFESMLKIDKKMADKIPNNFKQGDWERYYYLFDDDDIYNESLKYFDLVSLRKEDKEVALSKSGWDPSKFKEMAKWLEQANSQADAIRIEFVAKINRIEKWVTDHKYLEDEDYDIDNDAAVRWCISHSCPSINKILHLSDDILEELHKTLSRVASHFKLLSD
jgi:hypothetical protein